MQTSVLEVFANSECLQLFVFLFTLKSHVIFLLYDRILIHDYINHILNDKDTYHLIFFLDHSISWNNTTLIWIRGGFGVNNKIRFTISLQ